LWRVPIDEASGRTLGPPQPVTTPSTWSGWISFARDGSRLAFADLDDRSTVWTAGFDARAEKVLGGARRVLRGRGILSIDWSPDAAALAFTQRGQPWETLGIVKADGSGVARLTESSYFSRVPAWSPDGERWQPSPCGLPGARSARSSRAAGRHAAAANVSIRRVPDRFAPSRKAEHRSTPGR